MYTQTTSLRLLKTAVNGYHLALALSALRSYLHCDNNGRVTLFAKRATLNGVEQEISVTYLFQLQYYHNLMLSTFTCLPRITHYPVVNIDFATGFGFY